MSLQKNHFPPLNCSELEFLTKELSKELSFASDWQLQGFSDSDFLSEDSIQTLGKKNFQLKLHSKNLNKNFFIFFGLAQDFSYFAFHEKLQEKKKNKKKSYPGIFQKTINILESLNLIEVKNDPNERILELIWGGSSTEFKMIFSWIPSKIGFGIYSVHDSSWTLLSFQNSDFFKNDFFTTKSKIQKIFPIRNSILNLTSWFDEIVQTAHSKYEDKKNKIQNSIREQKLKKLFDDKRKIDSRISQIKAEPDWSFYGNLITENLSFLENQKQKTGLESIELEDFREGKKILVPLQKKWTLIQNRDSYFNRKRRNDLTLSENQMRLLSILKEIESIQNENTNLEPTKINPKKTPKKLSKWSGFLSETLEGLSIAAGKNSEENMNLSLKTAKGHDLWFHLKGQASAHVVIFLEKHKSASLESLLDAAHCVLHFSGVSSGEVDYTQVKYLRRIPKSNLVSYSQNKTLRVSKDPERMKRILSKRRV